MDGNGHMITTTYSGKTMNITLSPVSDVDAFSKKIDFGEVTETDGRSLKVDFTSVD